MRKQTIATLSTLALVTLILIGCQTTYYSVWEKLGKEKRHLLHEQIVSANEEQKAAALQFETTLEGIKQLYGFEGGAMEQFYAALTKDYARCQKRADAVSRRIWRMNRIAGDLFREWKSEIGEIGDSKLRDRSRQALIDARGRYDNLNVAMTSAEEKMAPLLASLRDYVLTLKHNLNAQAVGSLKTEANDIEAEVTQLVEEIKKATRVAEDFLATLG